MTAFAVVGAAVAAVATVMMNALYSRAELSSGVTLPAKRVTDRILLVADVIVGVAALALIGMARFASHLVRRGTALFETAEREAHDLQAAQTKLMDRGMDADTASALAEEGALRLQASGEIKLSGSVAPESFQKAV